MVPGQRLCLVFMYIYSHMSAKIVVQLLFCNKYIFGHKQCSTLSAWIYFEIQSSCHICHSIQFQVYSQ